MKLKMLLIAPLFFSPISFADITLGTKEILLSNDAVEVVRLTYPVGTESGFHTHIYPNRVVYVVKGGTLELISTGKKPNRKVINISDGQTLFSPSTTHNVKNIGDTEIVIIETEIKNN